MQRPGERENEVPEAPGTVAPGPEGDSGDNAPETLAPGPVGDSGAAEAAADAAYNLDGHALSARDQILRQWPLLDLERR